MKTWQDNLQISGIRRWPKPAAPAQRFVILKNQGKQFLEPIESMVMNANTYVDYVKEGLDHTLLETSLLHIFEIDDCRYVTLTNYKFVNMQDLFISFPISSGVLE